MKIEEPRNRQRSTVLPRRGELRYIHTMGGNRRISIRRAHLGDPDPDLRESTDVAQRIALVWVLTLESWKLAGRPLPQYSRNETPIRVVPLGSS